MIVDRSVMLDAGFVVALVAVVFLGPVPAACIWIATEVVAFCFERVRPTAFFANLASFSWAAIAGGLVMTVLADGAPLTHGGVTVVAAVALTGLVMQAVNYFVVRSLLAAVRDGRKLAKIARTELVGSAPAIALMTALGTATVFLHMEIGVLALGIFALAVQVPQLLLPALMRPRPVAELDHTGAVRLYALAIGDVLDLGYRKCQVLKDAAQFIRERPLVPRDGELTNVSTEHRLALVESVLYYREHWDGVGGRPGAFGGELIPLTSRDPGGRRCLGRPDLEELPAAEPLPGDAPARVARGHALRPRRRRGRRSGGRRRAARPACPGRLPAEDPPPPAAAGRRQDRRRRGAPVGRHAARRPVGRPQLLAPGRFQTPPPSCGRKDHTEGKGESWAGEAAKAAS